MADPELKLIVETHQGGGEPKRSRTIVILFFAVLLALCAIGVHLLVGFSGPAEVEAAPSSVVPFTVHRAPKDSPDAELPQSPHEQYQASLLNDHIRKIDRNITRDLFAPDPAVFPPTPEASPGDVITAEGGSPAERKAVRLEAASLILQSTVISSNSIAIINNEMLRVGDQIKGFEVLKSEPHTCKVRKNSITVILEMSK
jgi:hypothetical protein